MSSYVVTGASRGLGFEFLRQLSEDPSNIVVGLVRSVEAAKEKVFALNRPNIHLLHADIDHYETVFEAAAETAKITGGKLDYLVGNAGRTGGKYHLSLSEFAQLPSEFEDEMNASFRTNAIGQAHLLNAFMPLVLQGNAKKVVLLTTGVGMADFTAQNDLWMAIAYAVSKAALNMIIAKASAEYRGKGVLILGISPGVVDTSEGKTIAGSDDTSRADAAMGAGFSKYAPDWKGPITPEESVKLMRQVIANASAEKDGGDVLSHWGNKKWL